MDTQSALGKVMILDFLRRNKTELPTESVALDNFIDQALRYLSASDTIKSIAAQKAHVTGQLMPAEKAACGSFSFVLEHNVDHDKGPTAPTIQVSGTSGNFHALIIKQQSVPLDGYEYQQPITLFGRQYQMGLATGRIRSDVDLAQEFPALHTLKVGCQAERRPIIYFLGAARQFPNAERQSARVVANQTKAINTIFSAIEDSFGDNVVIGTGGWAGTKEGSLGVPRIGYLHAVSTNRLILTTMPHVGAYDRHENPTLEVFCGEEWGDDSAILAAACDAAFVFSPYGTWTQIEVENLLAQNKPFVVIDDPKNALLQPTERKRQVDVQRGTYFVYRNADDAANDLLQKLNEAGFISNRRPSSASASTPFCQCIPGRSS